MATDSITGKDKRLTELDGEVDKKLLEAEVMSDERDDITCGIGSWRPESFQKLADIRAFVGFMSVAGLASSCLSIYISSQITTLERTFGFSSSISGVIMSGNDFGYLLSILFASYFARRTHIPRVLSLSTAMYGVSGLICCIPYFLTNEHFNLKTDSSHSDQTSRSPSASRVTRLCMENETEFNVMSSASCSSREEITSMFGLSHDESTMAVAIISIGMVLQGFAKAPRYPFINTYVDDNSPRIKTPLYLGIMMGIAILGPAISFSVGGVFTRIYVTLQSTTMSYRDPRFVGAWWLGFLIFGGFGVVVSVPLAFFPRHLRPKSERLAIQKTKLEGNKVVANLKGLLKALLRLAKNPIYCPLVVAQCFHAISSGGGIAFFAKFLETQFSIPSWKANLLMGGFSIPTASLGAFAGGKIISKFKLTPKQCLKMMIYLHTFHWILYIAQMFLTCPQVDVRADWKAFDYQYGSQITNSSCFDNCFCDKQLFHPVCDVTTGTTFYSACHAGCASRNGSDYTDCACATSSRVLPGYCEPDCNLLTPYVVIMVLSALSGSLSIMNFIVLTMRSVSEEDKPLAIGLNSFLSNLIGWMPGPIIFGALIDTTCLIWNSSCSRQGSCALYDVTMFKYTFLGTAMILRGISLVLKFFVMFKVNKLNFFEKMSEKIVTGIKTEKETVTTEL